MESMDVNLDFIKFHAKIGGKFEYTELVHGLVMEKAMSSPRMLKEIDGANIALLACSFEPSKAFVNELVKKCRVKSLFSCIHNYINQVLMR
jgi:chaperonin GroEL (HSP60 family)